MTLSSIDLGLPPWEVVGILTGGLAFSSFALSGTREFGIEEIEQKLASFGCGLTFCIIKYQQDFTVPIKIYHLNMQAYFWYVNFRNLGSFYEMLEVAIKDSIACGMIDSSQHTIYINVYIYTHICTYVFICVDLFFLVCYF